MWWWFVLWVVVIALLFTLNLPTKVADAIASAINSVFSQGNSSYTAPTVKSP